MRCRGCLARGWGTARRLHSKASMLSITCGLAGICEFEQLGLLQVSCRVGHLEAAWDASQADPKAACWASLSRSAAAALLCSCASSRSCQEGSCAGARATVPARQLSRLCRPGSPPYRALAARSAAEVASATSLHEQGTSNSRAPSGEHNAKAWPQLSSREDL